MMNAEITRRDNAGLTPMKSTTTRPGRPSGSGRSNAPETPTNRPDDLGDARRHLFQ
jgi:hypothetical protein